MLKKYQRSHHNKRHFAKYHGVKKKYKFNFRKHFNRREFLQSTIAISLLTGISACKPNIETPKQTDLSKSVQPFNTTSNIFSQVQLNLLDAVQMRLFPDDGNGPDAQTIQALPYLQGALTDKSNVDDGDPEFILQGLTDLEQITHQKYAMTFVNLTNQQQDDILTTLTKSESGENWISLLLYYLTEALMLAPVYGGNPDGIGWSWLELKPAFPLPVVGKTYRDFS